VVTFKFIWKIHLSPLYFLAIKWPIPLILEIFILVSNFIFIIFSLFWVEGERGLSDFGLERETYCCDDFDHQNNRFMCFLYWKCLNYIFVFRKIFYFKLILDLKMFFFFALLEVMNRFNKVLMIFSRYFG